eukprot:EG_transcript_8385
MAATARPTVAYITDIEGDIDFLHKSVDASPVLTRTPSGRHTCRLDFAAEGTYFVMGGDAFDHGAGDLRIAAELVDFKQRHPDRVFLILGNRDANKLKLTSECDEAEIRRPLDSIPGPYWDANTPTLQQWLAQQATAAQQPVEALNTAVSRLQYYLSMTMGSPGAFEYRRQELAVLRDTSPEAITDDDVFRSYMESLRWPDGVVCKYVSYTQPALILGNSLFVHGAVNPLALGFVPPASGSTDGVDACIAGDHFYGQPLAVWADALNQRWRAAFADWARRPTWNADRTSRGGETFFGYCYLSATGPRSVIYMSLAPDGQPVLPEVEVGRVLRENGIQWVLLGHRPFGDAPQVLRDTVHGVHYAMCDTCYSNPPEARGPHGPRRAPDVVHQITIEGPVAGPNALRLQGVLSTGHTYDSVIDDDPVQPLGRRTKDGWWVKCRDGDKDAFVVTRGCGFKVSCESRGRADLDLSD